MGVEQAMDHGYEPVSSNSSSSNSSQHLMQHPLTWIDMQNYRDPPPYPGHSKQQVYTNQPGFRQSFSGSETSTDVSLSSTENLATSQRQEPQGEETVQTSLYNHLDLSADGGTGYSILARLGMPPGALEAAVAGSGGGKSATMPSSYAASFSSSSSLPSLSSSTSSSAGYLIHNHQQQQLHGLLNSSGVVPSPLTSQGHLTVPPQWQHTGGRNVGGISSSVGQFSGTAADQLGSVPSSSSTSLLPRNILDPSTSSSSAQSGLYSHSSHLFSSTSSSSPSVQSRFEGLHAPPSLPPSSSSSHLHQQQYLTSPRTVPVSSFHHRHPYVNQGHHWSSGGGSDDATSSLLSTTLTPPPPPEYPSSRGPNTAPSPLHGESPVAAAKAGGDIRTCRSYEMMDKVDRGQQRSHPDLRLCASSPGMLPPGSGSSSSQDEGEARVVSQVVEMLTEQNRSLREELAAAAVKVKKLHKLELEIQKVHESHEGLVKSSQKQEALWQAMKRRLEEKIRTLEAGGGGATGQLLDRSSTGGSNQNLSPGVPESEVRTKLAEKDAMISKLLSQNQELSSCRDQLEGENAQLSLSVSEHRAHVDILEAAMLNAQTKIVALEDEYSRKQAYADKVGQLQDALKSLQLASEKQEKKGQEVRARLEKELEEYKSQEKNGGAKRPEAGKDDDKSVAMLRKMLDEKDARILQLETEMAGLEQKYVKEATLRQLHMEEKSQAPKEVRLAALEKSSSDMEKMIDEAKTEKLKHMEELHQSQRKVAELEAKVKQLQTQLVEKEAMVKVFQRAPMARSSSLHALCHPALQRPSLLGGGWQAGGSNPHREFATIRHMKTGSTSAIELGRKMSVEEDLLNKVQNLGRTSTEDKKDTEEEVKLWHV